MARPFELLVGLRYTRAKRRNHFISFISLSSMIGIALGVTVLITVLSVMNGFGEELRARILGVVSHITISGDRGPLAGGDGCSDSLHGLVLGNGDKLHRFRTAAGAVRGLGDVRTYLLQISGDSTFESAVVHARQYTDSNAAKYQRPG